MQRAINEVNVLRYVRPIHVCAHPFIRFQNGHGKELHQDVDGFIMVVVWITID
jgi:hypothetical protein